MTPQFLAWRTENATAGTVWWQPGSRLFTIAGPDAESITTALFGGATKRIAVSPEISVPLISAAMMMPFIAAMQINEFRFDGPRLGLSRSQIRQATASANEARRAIAAAHGRPRPSPLRAAAVSTVLRTVPVIASFDVPVFLRTHFGRHAEQTVRLLEDWIELGRAQRQETPTLETLYGQLDRVVRATADGADQPV
ncbi:MAG: hypothetical protein GX542_02260 [Rhodococcus sp.]|nr:hypothetical protein [Rhodococcus sp. (in: high G+C Gram-positive bacteria)]